MKDIWVFVSGGWSLCWVPELWDREDGSLAADPAQAGAPCCFLG